MKITTVSFGKTFNTGNYESVRIDLTAEVDDTEHPQDVYKELREVVEKLGEGEKERNRNSAQRR